MGCYIRWKTTLNKTGTLWHLLFDEYIGKWLPILPNVFNPTDTKVDMFLANIDSHSVHSKIPLLLNKADIPLCPTVKVGMIGNEEDESGDDWAG